MAAQVAHLQRVSFRLIWLNPLLGVPGYRPITRGMATALPYIDDFLPAHNLASLEALATLLAELDNSSRRVRRQRPPVAVAPSKKVQVSPRFDVKV